MKTNILRMVKIRKILLSDYPTTKVIQYYMAAIDNKTVIQVIVIGHAIALISLLLGNNRSIQLGGNNP